eukprot:360740-Chlamydomonas_euryale.AAC.6
MGWQLCARFSRPDWRGGLGMGWLRTLRSGVPFVTALSPLLDPLCLAALNAGIPFVGPLPVTVSLTLKRTQAGEPKAARSTAMVNAKQAPDGSAAACRHKRRNPSLCSWISL